MSCSAGWFSSRPDHVRAIWVAIGLAVTAAGVGFTVLLARSTSLGLLGIPLVVAGIALMIGAKWMPRRTAVGHGVYRRALGFEEFIEHSEKHRAEWAERRHLFTEYLPYAISLGATKQWARTLDALGAPPPQQSGWYVGHSVYGWSMFGDRMNSFTSSDGVHAVVHAGRVRQQRLQRRVVRGRRRWWRRRELVISSTAARRRRAGPRRARPREPSA